MKTYARIENSVIAELFSTDGNIAEMFSVSLKWVDVSLVVPAPQPGWLTHDGGKTFLPPALPTIMQIKERLLSLVTTERFKRWRSGFPVLVDGTTKWFHSDEFSLVQHLGLKDKARDLLAAGGALSDNLTIGGLPVVWSTMDGTQVTITAQVAFDLVEAAGFQQAAIFAAAETHRAGALASATPETYDYLQDWPLVFGEAINP